jgi:hypothetical protein
MSPEDIEVENVDRAERLLVERFEKLPNGVVSNIDKIRQNLITYEIGGIILDRIATVMYEVSLMDELSEIEESIKYLSDTLWHQM